MKKLKLFQEALKREGIEAALVTSSTNLFYLTDFFASAVLLVTPCESWYFTDFRTIEGAQKHFFESGVHLEQADGDFVPIVCRLARDLKLSTLALENNTLTVSQFNRYTEALPCTAVLLNGLLENLRHQKLPEEIECMIRAQRIAEQSLKELLPMIRPGVSEQDLVAEMVYRLYKNKAEGLAFPVIILSGTNSSLPHGFPGSRILQPGDFVTLDFGAKIGGYCSDMTRTFALEYATDEMKEVYDLVLKAQLAGIDALAPGKTGDEVDNAARTIIDSTPYKGTFGHGLGHSVGLICHDGQRASLGSKDIFTVGNVITMEPGIYLPGRFGVRIEDMVWISPEGRKNLTEYPKELTIL
ncbi:MAG: aminopeptidase P family protein [Clostridiaceae bacterium]|nr:aminopeptidase P family protein [Clostridiaceae bacterium]